MSLLFRRIDGETRIGIFATRDIKKGEHLTYDYQYGCLEFVYICIMYCTKEYNNACFFKIKDVKKFVSALK